jgi:asparagine synthase (glutamine-hydrolysing)
MCGLFGYLHKNSTVGQSNLSARLWAAKEALQHRGPNDHGVESFSIPRDSGLKSFELTLGHTRLSIIDLSSGGHQPMHSRDGRLSIVFNGEIYNYRELRFELQSLGCVFSTDSDTEVLSAVWAKWGVNGLHRLTGMFAFAVYDRQEQTLTMVRDAFGIKPFFYSIGDEGFGFASEIPALAALLPCEPTLNWQRAYDFLVHGDYDSQSSTLLNGVLHLAPGHFIELELSTGVLSVQKRWWIPHIAEQSDLSFSHATEMVRELFLDNMRLHLRSDVPLGAALSGGVDSSAVVCAMRHIEPKLPIHTFSFIASGSDVNEEHWVDRVNAYVGAIPHKVHVTAQELTADLDDMIKSQGEPFGSTSIYAQYRVFKSAKEDGMTVTLDGQGADEMLAGYIGYPGQRLRSLVETGRINEAWDFLNEWSQWPGRSKLHAVKALLGQLTEGALYAGLRRMNGDQHRPTWLNEQVLQDAGVSLSYPSKVPEITLRGRRVVAELAASLSQRGLNSLLRHGDRNSMRFSIESRVPFLTTDLAELLLSLPEQYLIAPNGETKHVFRAAMRGIVPDDVLDRKDKIGFATPEKDWLLVMAPTIRKWLSVPIDLPFINQSALLREFDKVVSGAIPFTWQVWRWVNFYRWYQLNRRN